MALIEVISETGDQRPNMSTKDALLFSYSSGNSKGLDSSMPEVGMKTKYILYESQYHS